MKFSTKTTYGLRSMMYLAQSKDRNNPLSSIAKKENISLKYLERIFAKLKKNKLVFSEKGVNGGYSLAKKPNKITVFDIVKSLEGDFAPFYCVNSRGKVFCSSKCGCGVTDVLKKIQDSLEKTLKNIKLSSLQ